MKNRSNDLNIFVDFVSSLCSLRFKIEDTPNSSGVLFKIRCYSYLFIFP